MVVTNRSIANVLTLVRIDNVGAFRLVAALLGLAVAIGRPVPATASTITLLNDTFADGDRTNQDLPDSAAWYFGSSTAGAGATASSGALVLDNNGSSTVATTAYFTPIASPRTLYIGDIVTLAFDFSYTGTGSLTTGLRFGLFDSGGNRLLEDVTTNNGEHTAYDTWGGYSVFAPVNTTSSLGLYRRSNAQDNTAETPIGTNQNTSIGSALNANSTNNTVYTNNTLTITRTAAGVDLLATVAGTTVTASDNSGAYTAFDAVHFWFHPNALNTTATIDNVSVTANLAMPEILVDFNTAATNPTAGGTWNSIASPPTAPVSLVDIDGNSTSMTLHFTSPPTDSSSTDPGWSDPSVPWVAQEAVQDFFYFGGGGHGQVPVEMVIGGLNDDLVYNIELAASRNNATDNLVCDYLIQGEFTTNSQGFDTYADGFVNHEVMVWTHVAPVDGKIVLNADVSEYVAGNNFGYVNAMRIVSVPEPASAALLLLALAPLGLLRIRRRRS